MSILCGFKSSNKPLSLYCPLVVSQKLMIFDTVEKYKTEFSNYKDGYCADFDDYYDQRVEEDARGFSNYAPDVYLERTEKNKN